jgi:hypothetical protein
LADLFTIVRNSIISNLEGAPAWQQETEHSALVGKRRHERTHPATNITAKSVSTMGRVPSYKSFCFSAPVSFVVAYVFSRARTSVHIAMVGLTLFYHDNPALKQGTRYQALPERVMPYVKMFLQSADSI